MTVATTRVYESVELLEGHLGDPFASTGPLGYAAILAGDEAETFPEHACSILAQWGLCDYFVPREFGGKLGSFEEALALLRAVSRRDLTCAIALGQTYLGAVHVWIGGDADQRAQVARLIAQRHLLAFALTEREHGSDVLANEVEATAVEGGYRISGEKWLINNGSRARALSVFARTGAAGPRGHSLFCIDVSELERASYERLPKIRTHGIRGADISGIRFRDAFVASSARIGAAGIGLELALRGLMITRTMCAGFALGAADTALRLALRFARGRRLYGAPVFAMPAARRQLVDAFADLIAADVVAVTSARALQVSPEETSVRSAIVKYAVPVLAEEVVRSAGSVLGARHFVRDVAPWSVHQKIARDVAVVGLFDGNAAVNLNAIAVQLPALLRARGEGDRDNERSGRLEHIFSRTPELEDFDPERVALTNRGRDDVLDGLPSAAAQLASMETDAIASSSIANGSSYSFAADVARMLIRARAELAAEVATFATQAARSSAAAFECARRYCYIHAGATLVWHLVYAARGDVPNAPQPATLALGLARVARRAGIAGAAPEAFFDVASDDLLRFEREQLLFSAFPFRIADAGFAATQGAAAAVN